MADLHVYLPDELKQRLDEIPDVNYSEICALALIATLDRRATCRHTRIRCAVCGAFLD